MTKTSLRFAFSFCALLGLAHSVYSQSPGPVSTWDRIGAVNTSSGVGLIETGGDDGNPTVSASQLSTFFGGVFLPGNANGSPTDGSGIRTNFSLMGTTSVGFAYALVTNESIGSGYDRAFVFLDGQQFTLGNDSIPRTPGISNNPASPAGFENLGLVTVLTITNLSPGTHTVGFGVYDTQDTEVPSGVFVQTLPDLNPVLGIAADQREILLSLTSLATFDVNSRLFLLRAGAYEPEEGETTLALAMGDGKSTADGKEAKATKEIVQPVQRVEFFTAGGYGYADRDNLALSNFVSHTYDGSVGVEVHLDHHLTLGLAYTHLENYTEFSGNAGKLRITGNAVTPYVSYARDNFYVDALYSFTDLDESIARNTTGGLAVAHPSSNNSTVDLDLGYNFKRGQLVTGPFFGLDYTNGQLDAYTENGLPGAVISSNQQNYDSLLTRLGWQASYKVPTSFGSVTPQLRASWDRENLDDSGTVGVSVPGTVTQTLNAATGTITTGGPFGSTVATPRPTRDYLNVGAGVAVKLGTRGVLVLDYEDHLLRSGFSERFASLKFGIKF